MASMYMYIIEAAEGSRGNGSADGKRRTAVAVAIRRVVTPNSDGSPRIRRKVHVMAAKPVLIPGPDHPITIQKNPDRIVVKFGGRVIVDTTSALTLQKSTYPATQYIPRADVDFSVLEASDQTTYCPYKGDAGYFSIRVGDQFAENAIWTYEAPHDSVPEIKDHVAFYVNRVDSFEQTPA